MNDKIVTGHLLNTFLYEFYLQVEGFFYRRGFQLAEFEYCLPNKRKCLEEGVSVKNSKYKITKIFPQKRDYYRAFGGVNQNSGVYFSHMLTDEQANKRCTTQLRSGGKISKKARFAIETDEIPLGKMREDHYKKDSLWYVEYLPQINALDKVKKPASNECWLVQKSKKIIFEVKENVL